ncbi:MAG: hypothetical protein M3319_13590, partial [Actinomycetota bacterium]|nr:hypothetical protein [Actinomycetota bacterium]
MCLAHYSNEPMIYRHTPDLLPPSRDGWDEAPVDHWDHLWDDQLTWKGRRPVKRSLTRVVVELTLTVPVTGAVTAPAFGSAKRPDKSRRWD